MRWRGFRTASASLGRPRASGATALRPRQPASAPGAPGGRTGRSGFQPPPSPQPTRTAGCRSGCAPGSGSGASKAGWSTAGPVPAGCGASPRRLSPLRPRSARHRVHCQRQRMVPARLMQPQAQAWWIPPQPRPASRNARAGNGCPRHLGGRRTSPWTPHP